MVVRPLVVVLLETRAVLAHDRDDPKDELADLHHDSAKAIRARDVRVGGRGCKLVDQLVEVHDRLIRHLRRWRFWGRRWHTSFELVDESIELRALFSVEVRPDTCNLRLDCHLRATMATERGKNLTTTSTKSRVRAMKPHHGQNVLRTIHIRIM